MKYFATGGVAIAAIVLASVFFTNLRANPTAHYRNEIEPILAEYCYDCHGDGMDKGDVALDEFETMEHLFSDYQAWEGVYTNMESFLMPPAEKPQPTDEERKKIIAWIERDVFKLDPKNPDPGRVTIRRLNREEYNNTVRDLVGVDLRPADEFPEDDSGYGFDNVGDVLSVSPALMERYVKTSGQILDEVIVTEAPKALTKNFRGGTFQRKAGNPDPNSGSMSSSGTLGVKFKVPEDGEYRIEIRAGGSPAKNEWPLMRVETEKGPKKDFRVDQERRGGKVFSLTAKWKKGDGRWIDVIFLNDLYDPKAKDPRQRDRNLYLSEIRVIGPLNRKIPHPSKAHQSLFSVANADADEKTRARQIVTQFTRRAWRRPVEASEVDRLMQFYSKVRETEKGSFDEGVKLAFQAAMVSPNFLFRGEIRDLPNDPTEIVEVNEHDLANRLSYFIWSSMPDEKLFDLAERGELRKNLDSEIERMLLDPKALALTKNFAGQWLQLRNLRLASPDPKTYKGWNDQLRDAMQKETEYFFAGVVRDNRSVLDFIDADYTYLNDQLAKHYGISDVKGSNFQRVSLNGNAKSQRGGVLTHASILTLTSNPTRTSAVNRGNFVLENILGTPPPPPPEDVPTLEEAAAKDGNKNKTLREQLEMHSKQSLCASCHKRMDPIGFGLENFDGIGRWRDQEAGKTIDASGTLYTGEDFKNGSELRKILAESKSNAFVHCLTEKLLIYALGRGVEYYDKPTMTKITEEVAANDYKFHALVKAIVHSAPFQKFRGDETPDPSKD